MRQDTLVEEISYATDRLMLKGPNGTHCCFVSHFARPSLSSLSECPGRVAGSKRLRALLARKTVKQVVDLADFLHGVGIVHGGSFSNYMSLLC